MSVTIRSPREPRLAVPARARRPLHPAGAVPALGIETAAQFAREAVREAVARHVDGTLGAIVGEHMDRDGKQVRIELALRCASLMRVPLRNAVPLAAAAELLHNATLVHDDLQDGDRVRRGAPTVWVRHGMAQAINAGDVLLMLPFLVLAESPDAAARNGLTAMVAARAAATACGQSEELSLLPTRRLAWRDYADAARGKTGQIFAIPFEGAALLAGLGRQEARQVGELASWLGLAYQVADDVLDLYGDKGRERVGNDLREGKVSAVCAVHLEREPGDHDALVALLELDRDRTSDDKVRAWSHHFIASGSAAEALDRARTALAWLESAPLPETAEPLRGLMCGLRERFLRPAEQALEALR